MILLGLQDDSLPATETKKEEEKPDEGATSGTTTEEKKDETKPILYIEYFSNLISEQCISW